MLGTVKSVDLNPVIPTRYLQRCLEDTSSQAVGREPQTEAKSGMLGQTAAVTGALLPQTGWFWFKSPGSKSISSSLEWEVF